MRMSMLALLLSLVLPGLAPAQSRPFERQLRAAAAFQASVRLPAGEAGTPSLSELVSPRRFSSRTPGATLMIIGGAAFLAGLFVEGTGGTVLIVGGIGLGAYGVYLFTR